VLVLLTGPVHQSRAEEFYRFERMWPMLPQPWYFDTPLSTAVDANGYVYVADQFKHRVQKFSPDGMLVTSWGHKGPDDGQFIYPCGIAIDNRGVIYVADKDNHRIQKFTANGLFIDKWGSRGSGDGAFVYPYGVAVDESGLVHVTDSSNHRVQTFTDNGTFIRAWGGPGSGPGSFQYPCGIASDLAGFLYVADQGNSRVQKFTSSGAVVPSAWDNPVSPSGQLRNPYGIFADGSGTVYVADTGNDRIAKFTDNGTFITSWGSKGQGDDQFANPRGIALSARGQLYIADTVNGRIKKYTAQGAFITQWTSSSAGPGFFSSPIGIAAASDGALFVADSDNNRIQKFDSKGRHELSWGSYGSGNGQFNAPKGLALDAAGTHLYVADMSNNRIQKFKTDGAWEASWGEKGSGQGAFNRPYGIALDGLGNIYVADSGNNLIQKFTAGGVFIKQWGGLGAGDGQFNTPYCVAADGKGFIYVADNGNDRIVKFTTAGDFVMAWGFSGEAPGQLSAPTGIVVDADGFLYVADTGNHRIQKFSDTGGFVAVWGGPGGDPGQMSYPDAVAPGPAGLIYVSDTENNRIQAFKKVERASNNKAIIVAGGGPYPGNTIWNETQSAANFAFRTLLYQGFTKDSIYYLSPDIDLDLDGNGKADEVDADATIANFSQAVVKWARGADNLVIYLVDHGGASRFRMNQRQMLKANMLNRLIARVELSIRGTVIIVYDACQSGSFLKELKAPWLQKRVVIASTSPGEAAQFIALGAISFSNYFWTQVFNGLSVYDAYAYARDAISYTMSDQLPLLDDTGDGRATSRDGEIAQQIYIGNGAATAAEAPFVTSTSPQQAASPAGSASIFADVQDAGGIARVWAVIRPPDFQPADPGNPVSDLPSVDLVHAGSQHYEAVYSGFFSPGTYQVSICALDSNLNLSTPKLTSVIVGSSAAKKAILVAGSSRSDAALAAAVEKVAAGAYHALRFQGYRDVDITYIASSSLPGVDRMATRENLESALTQLAAADSRDAILCLIGAGDSRGFYITDTDVITADSLQGLLTGLQQNLSGPLVVVYDGNDAGGFLQGLVPPAGLQRILIAGAAAGQNASFLSGGDISFSSYFWSKIANGGTLRDAFRFARDAIRYACPKQNAVIDDNGNGIGNEYEDGRLAQQFRLGQGVMLAGDEPVVGSLTCPETLSGSPVALIMAGQVTGTSAIAQVRAIVTPPAAADNQDGGAPSVVTLHRIGLESYMALLKGLDRPGAYTVSVYAIDELGAVSIPVSATLTKTGG
jgi:DNA-binding beta-propeller fold protein YncE